MIVPCRHGRARVTSHWRPRADGRGWERVCSEAWRCRSSLLKRECKFYTLYGRVCLECDVYFPLLPLTCDLSHIHLTSHIPPTHLTHLLPHMSSLLAGTNHTLLMYQVLLMFVCARQWLVNYIHTCIKSSIFWHQFRHRLERVVFMLETFFKVLKYYEYSTLVSLYCSWPVLETKEYHLLCFETLRNLLLSNLHMIFFSTSSEFHCQFSFLAGSENTIDVRLLRNLAHILN